MKIIDLTHTISENMTVYPGDEPPRLEIVNWYVESGFKQTRLVTLSHTGTHMDAPAHLFDNGTTLDSFGVEQFIGIGLVIDCSNICNGDKITISCIEAVKEKADKAEFILFYTGFDKYWGTTSYFNDYPCITKEVAEYLIKSKKKGIGLDVISVDAIQDDDLTIHKELLCKNNIVIVENLANLNEIGSELFTFCALPIKFINSDGAPVRAVAISE